MARDCILRLVQALGRFPKDVESPRVNKAESRSVQRGLDIVQFGDAPSLIQMGEARGTARAAGDVEN